MVAEEKVLDKLLGDLTTNQKHELDQLGIPSSRRSEWKAGKRRPTAAQLVVLAHVMKLDPVPLLFWLAEEEANPAQRDVFRRVKEGGSWARLMSVATLILGVGLASPDPAFAQCSSGKARFEPSMDVLHIVRLTDIPPQTPIPSMQTP